MVGAAKAGEDLAGQIIVISELFYNRRTQLRFLFAVGNIINAQVKQLQKELPDIADEEAKLQK